MGREWPVVWEELLVAIDFAGRLQADNMKGQAIGEDYAPDWANSVERLAVLALSNGDQLGASIVYCTLDGTAFPNGPHQIICGAHGGENADLANEGAAPTVLEDMGIKVVPNGNYTVFFQTVGDTQDEFGCSIEITWNSDAPRQEKKWKASARVTAAVDTDVQGANLNAVAVDMSPDGAEAIGGFIGCAAGDMAALGVNHGVALLSVATMDDLELICGGVGGELVVGSGAHVAPSQRVNCNFPLKKGGKKNIFIEFRGIIEAGVIMIGCSIGLVM